MQELRTCARCNMAKHTSAFWRHAWCKECHSTYYREYRERRAHHKEASSKATDDLYILTFTDAELASRFGVKVGRSDDPLKRAQQLANAMPMELRVFATFPGQGKCERRVHRELRDHSYSIGGCREWFTLTPWEAVQTVSGILEQTPCQPSRQELH